MMLQTGLMLAPARSQQRWWPEGALFAADFVNNRFMSGGVAIPAAAAYGFTRGSPKRAQASNGTWHLFADNVPAITDRGLSIEQAGTNLLPNSAFAGGVAATYAGTGSTNLPAGYTIRNMPAGCSADISYGTEAGLPCMDIRLYGTATNNTPFVLAFSPNTYVPCSTGETLQVSVFARLVSGTPPNNVTLRTYEYDAGGTNSSTVDSTALDVTAQTQRFERSYMATGPSTTSVLVGIRLGVGTSIAADFTIRIAACQAELGVGPPTSPVLTTGTSISRAADNLVVYLPAGANSVSYALSDSTTNQVGASPGDWAVPHGIAPRVMTGLAVLP